MLLVIDIGNTNTVLGLYREQVLLHSWRLTTDKARTSDEYAILVHELFRLSDLHFTDVKDVIISCVVRPFAASRQRLQVQLPGWALLLRR
jgi:type III pantothenate kinase